MSLEKLAVSYPASKTSAIEISISDVKPAPIDNTWVGFVQLPAKDAEEKVVIYEVTFENGDVDRRLVPAACPHQGYDISDDALKADGNVYCSLHRRPICVFSEHNRAFSVCKEGDRWFIPAS